MFKDYSKTTLPYNHAECDFQALASDVSLVNDFVICTIYQN